VHSLQIIKKCRIWHIGSIHETKPVIVIAVIWIVVVTISNTAVVVVVVPATTTQHAVPLLFDTLHNANLKHFFPSKN